MSNFMQMLKAINPDVAVEVPQYSAIEYAKIRASWYNANLGSLNKEDGINCDICMNKGQIQCASEEGETYVKECQCMRKRRAIKAMRSSGLGELIDKSFDNFNAVEEWQIRAKTKAVSYASKNNDDSWLYFSGQTGCGKTHLCTAICKDFLNQGRSLKYLLWGDISQKLNALKYKAEDYEQYMSELKSVDILYIDDFLKTPSDENGVPEKPQIEDIRNAYTVINARYFAKKKTIISSEHFMSEYERYDGAAAGRIKQMSELIQIERNSERNYRKKNR